MNWPVRGILLAALLLALTVPFKLIANRPPPDPQPEWHAKIALLDGFLTRHGVRGASPIVINPEVPGWLALRFHLKDCTAAVLPVYNDQDFELLRRLEGPGIRRTFIYRARTSQTYPRLAVTAEGIGARLAWPIRPARYHVPLVVLLYHSGDCRAVLGWDWLRLWDA